MVEEDNQPQAKTFDMGKSFIHENHDEDNWFLQIETFDPHEPYFTNANYKELYDHDFSTLADNDWPEYRDVSPEDGDLARHYRHCNAASTSMCDNYLGQVLDLMDRYEMWEDTMLIVNTDHGFLLGEHDYFGKGYMPFYNEIAWMPLFVWDPRARKAGERRQALVQTIDIAPTLLEFFGAELPRCMQGVSLRGTIADDTPVREAGLFGVFGGHVNVTDGRYVYMRASAPENGPLHEYTLMPTHMNVPFQVDELQEIGLAEPFSFTKGCRTMRIEGQSWQNPHDYGTLLFDIDKDPGQESPIDDPAVERRMVGLLVQEMQKNDSPPEQFERLGLIRGQPSN